MDKQQPLSPWIKIIIAICACFWLIRAFTDAPAGGLGIFFGQHVERNLVFRAVLVLVLLGLSGALHIMKRKLTLAYGVLEVSTGLIINWVSLGKSLYATVPLSEKVAVFVGGVYLTKRGIDCIVEAIEARQRPVTLDTISPHARRV
jgi:hypothetical protein